MFAESSGKFWNNPFVRKFDLLGYGFKRNGKCEARMKKTLKKSLGWLTCIEARPSV